MRSKAKQTLPQWSRDHFIGQQDLAFYWLRGVAKKSKSRKIPRAGGDLSDKHTERFGARAHSLGRRSTNPSVTKIYLSARTESKREQGIFN